MIRVVGPRVVAREGGMGETTKREGQMLLFVFTPAEKGQTQRGRGIHGNQAPAGCLSSAPQLWSLVGGRDRGGEREKDGLLCYL